jgi:acyl-CoA thioester hydrolase
MSSVSIESVTSTSPFTVRRRVRFGECDPAGIVFTPRFADFVVSAMDLFIGALLGGNLIERSRALGFGTPMKALSLVFSGPLRPDDEFDMVVTVEAIRNSTFDLRVNATSPTGTALFEATITPICVPHRGERRAIPIPPELRTKLEAYQATRSI